MELIRKDVGKEEKGWLYSKLKRTTKLKKKTSEHMKKANKWIAVYNNQN